MVKGDLVGSSFQSSCRCKGTRKASGRHLCKLSIIHKSGLMMAWRSADPSTTSSRFIVKEYVSQCLGNYRIGGDAVVAFSLISRYMHKS